MEKTTIEVTKDVHKALMQLKLDTGERSVNNVLKKLIKEGGKK